MKHPDPPPSAAPGCAAAHPLAPLLELPLDAPESLLRARATAVREVADACVEHRDLTAAADSLRCTVGQLYGWLRDCPDLQLQVISRTSWTSPKMPHWDILGLVPESN